MSQVIAAYKKWHGIARMMDQGSDAPEYGLLLDSELALFEPSGGYAGTGGASVAGAAGSAEMCGQDGFWSRLLDRIRAAEASKLWPAARVSSTLTTYNFGGKVRSGKDYDRTLIAENIWLVIGQAHLAKCQEPGCLQIKRQHQDVLFSWWTDLPWVNVGVAKRFFETVAKTPNGGGDSSSSSSGPAGAAAAGGWRAFARSIRFTRFEYMAYQQYCALREGFRFWDVTNITGEAKWGSYLEDPQPGARLADLRPMWVSMEALSRTISGTIPPLSKEAPPLLIFHVDHEACRIAPGLDVEKRLWEKLLLELLAKQGRTDFNKDSIKL